ncbi:hypothetical protein [Massilia violaceinigra]|uniref:hypothetical protein n=1 Tax=Massilia violaceinigra TaxID=2045208 RepID=UPI001E4CCE6F|nr:hypothetical protein [Massilia violaceinigra]
MNHPESISIPSACDQALLLEAVVAVQAAGHAVTSLFDPAARPLSMLEIAATIAANDVISMTILREALARTRPNARWDDDEEGRGALPPGEWWVCDPVEGPSTISTVCRTGASRRRWCAITCPCCARSICRSAAPPIPR